MVIVDITCHSFVDVITNSSTEIFVANSNATFVKTVLFEKIRNTYGNCRTFEVLNIVDWIKSLDTYEFDQYCDWATREVNEEQQLKVIRRDFKIPLEIDNKDLVVIYIDNNFYDQVMDLREYFTVYGN